MLIIVLETCLQPVPLAAQPSENSPGDPFQDGGSISPDQDG
jgi:hypothetical protein